MGNIIPLSRKYFESYALEIRSKFQRIRELTTHPNASGDYHEEILRSILRNFLTDRFSVKTGFVYKDTEHVSRQVDILIIDETTPATYLFKDEQFAIVTPESVVAAIEVKTTMNSSTFRNAIENLYSIKEQFDTPAQITTLAFGYKGTSPKSDTLHKWFKSQFSLNANFIPDGLMFFDASKLVLRWDNRFKDSDKFRFIELPDEEPNSNLGWQLSVFVAAIMSACELRQANQGAVKQFISGDKSVANRLMKAEGAEISDESYVFGLGRVIESKK